MAKSLWNKKRIRAELRSLNREKRQMSARYAKHAYGPLYRAACRRYGSWRRAIECTGISYGRIRAARPRPRWPTTAILSEIQRIRETTGVLNSSIIQLDYMNLYAAACARFGSWGKAVRAAGISYRQFIAKPWYGIKGRRKKQIITGRHSPQKDTAPLSIS